MTDAGDLPWFDESAFELDYDPLGALDLDLVDHHALFPPLDESLEALASPPDELNGNTSVTSLTEEGKPQFWHSDNGCFESTHPGTPDEPLSELLQNSMCQSAGKDHRKFLPLGKLEEIVTEERVRLQLQRASPWLPVSTINSRASLICKRFPRVYAILVLIELCQVIESFIGEDVDDSYLPLVKRTDLGRNPCLVKKSTPSSSILFTQEWPPPLVCSFEEHQWSLLPAHFLTGPDVESSELRFFSFNEKAILPFLSHEHDTGFKVGGHGVVRRVEIHPAHYRFERDSPRKFPSFAVKRFVLEPHWCYEGFASDFILENANHEHLSLPLASYRHENSHNFILPWANGGDLRSMWKENPSPNLDKPLVDWFTAQLRGLASAVQTLHQPYKSSERGGYSLRHGDLKPENILWFHDPSKENGKYSGSLKISDFGLTAVRSATMKSWPSPRGLSRMYCAPEIYQAPALGWSHEIGSAYDVWSMGCVFLESLTWLLLGWEAVQSFEACRREKPPDSVTIITGFEGAFFEIALQESPGCVKPRLHSAVIRLIESIHKSPKATQFCHDLLSILWRDMLRLDPSQRQSMLYISNAIKDLQQRCCDNEEYAMAPVAWSRDDSFADLVLESSVIAAPDSSSHHISIVPEHTTQSDDQPTGVDTVGQAMTFYRSEPRQILPKSYSDVDCNNKADPVRPGRLPTADHRSMSEVDAKQRKRPHSTDAENCLRARVKKPRRQTAVSEQTAEGQKKMFACPYIKHDKKYHGDRICRGPGWPTFHRVKEHVFRRHCSKFRCNRCREGFQDVEKLLAHQNSQTSCDERNKPNFIDDISDTQLAFLRKRTSKTKTDEEKWQDMYRTLFPEDATKALPSPFHDNEIISKSDDVTVEIEDGEFEAYVKGDISLEARAELEKSLEKYLSNNDNMPIRDKTIDAVLECHKSLLHSYRRLQSATKLSTVSTVPSLVEDSSNTYANNATDIDNAEFFDFNLNFDNIPASGVPLQSFLRPQSDLFDNLKSWDTGNSGLEPALLLDGDP